MADGVVADVDQRVKRRTARGEFLDGSDPDAGRYRSSSHKKARERRGLQISHVDLFFGETDMLQGTGSRVQATGTELDIEYGYLEGIAEAEQLALATYHNETGTVLRKFVGLTEEDGDEVLSNLAQDYGQTLGEELS